MLNAAIVQSALELGFIYGLVAMALFLSFRVLNIADMTTDGAFHPGLRRVCHGGRGRPPGAGAGAGRFGGGLRWLCHGLLQTRMGVPSILAGIITNTGLYTVNLAVMGFSSNVPMLKTETVFTLLRDAVGEGVPFTGWCWPRPSALWCARCLLPFCAHAWGSPFVPLATTRAMVRASSINTVFTITVGLCAANSMTALSGAVLAQYQRSADINLGTGMVVIGLASLIIGETLLGRGGLWAKVLAAVAGSVIYRFIIALALRQRAV